GKCTRSRMLCEPVRSWSAIVLLVFLFLFLFLFLLFLLCLPFLLFLLLLYLLDLADHVEGLLVHVPEVSTQDPLAALDGVLERDELAGLAGKLLGGEERLGEKSLQPACLLHRAPVPAGELLDAQHRDDVLEVFVLGQRAAHSLSYLVVPLAHHGGGKHLRVRL